MLKIEKRSYLISSVLRIDECCATPKQITIPFHDDIDRHVEQRMTRTNETGGRFSQNVDQVLLKRDPFVARQHRVPHAHDSIATPNHCGHVSNLITTGFALANRTS